MDTNKQYPMAGMYKTRSATTNPIENKLLDGMNGITISATAMRTDLKCDRMKLQIIILLK